MRMRWNRPGGDILGDGGHVVFSFDGPHYEYRNSLLAYEV